MTLDITELFLRISPFISMISLEFVGGDFSKRFRESIKTRNESLDFQNSETIINTFEEDSFKSHHIEKVTTHFDFAIISTIIIFVTSAYNSGDNTWGIAAIITIGLIVILRRLVLQYLTQRPPNRYFLEDYIELGRGSWLLRLHYGEVAVIVSNLIPILCIILSMI